MKNTLKNILIPIDLSDTALNALNTAIQMSKRHQATLHLLYIKDIMDYYPKLGQLAVLEPIIQDAWEKDLFLLEKIALSIRHTHQISCALHVKTGYRSTILTEQTGELDIDLMVVGTETGISEQSYLTDSLPYKILQNAPTHLLTVPSGNVINNFEHIIFPIISNEKPLNKFMLSQTVIAKNKASVSVIGMLKKHDLYVLKSIRNISDQVKFRLQLIAGSVTRSLVYTLSLAKDLVGLAKKANANLVVVSGDTNRNLKEFFLGNFTQRMIRNGEVAVLFIKELPEKVPTKSRLKIAYSKPIKLNSNALQLS